jgi:hypothetical protein
MEYEVTDLEHELIVDGVFKRVRTTVKVDGKAYVYQTYAPNESFTSFWDEGRARLIENNVCPAYLKDIRKEQMPIVAIMLS